MQIGFNTNVLNNIAQKKDEQTKALNEMSTGEKDKISDAALSMIAGALMSDISTDMQGVKNINMAGSMMQIADGALTQASKMGSHLQELSVASNNAALNSDQQSALRAEFSSTMQSIEASFSSATFNGKSVFGGEMSFSFGRSEASVTLSNISTDDVSIDSQDSIDKFVKQIQQNSSEVGSFQNNLRSTLDNMMSGITQKSAAKSGMSDTDIADAAMKYQQNDVMLEASMIAFAHQKELSAQRVSALLDY